MRIWDVQPKLLCQKHLIAEHRELHGLWNILTKHKGQGGYSHHPETLRWVGKLKALYLRHAALITEMQKRGYEHHSPLEKKLAVGKAKQEKFLDDLKKQFEMLNNKSCGCNPPKMPIDEKKLWQVYILRCADESLYAGITLDLKRRLIEHNGSKLGAKYTRARWPVELVWSKKFVSRSLAAKEESRIKKLSRKEKLQLIDKSKA